MMTFDPHSVSLNRGGPSAYLLKSMPVSLSMSGHGTIFISFSSDPTSALNSSSLSFVYSMF